MAKLVNAINHAKLMFYIFKLTVIYVAWQNMKNVIHNKKNGMKETRRTSTLVLPCMIYSACFSKGSYICSIMYKGNRVSRHKCPFLIPLQAFCFSIMLCHLPSVCRNVNKVAWKTSQQDTDAETRTQVSFAALFRSALCASGWADETMPCTVETQHTLPLRPAYYTKSSAKHHTITHNTAGVYLHPGALYHECKLLYPHILIYMYASAITQSINTCVFCAVSTVFTVPDQVTLLMYSMPLSNILF